MTTIGFIRHGITDWNALGKAQGISDIPLNEDGREQAGRMGERLILEQEWDMVISSDLSRAAETAAIIGRKLDLPVHSYERRLREIDCGEIEGTTEEFRVKKWGPNWSDHVTGMERFEAVGRRGMEAVEEIALAYPDKRILLISHGALIGLTLQQLLPDRFQSTYIDHTSLTILNHADGKWGCTLYNCTKHLDYIGRRL
ncbi:histidine phosphatase family protein [Rossellomorea sp. AcN35-11]|nr:histidine phosphatase family protein [Rossellomorea aquimaris]WJV29665.1 histidine phosphatase family protein [Rossellomorea sp. AcN35-11]